MRLLSLFAHGTWHEYKNAAPSTYPELTEAQVRQLQRLTLLSLTHASDVCEYTEIQQALDVPADPAFVEALVIECMDLGMMDGRIDAIEQRIYITRTQGRDFLPLPAGASPLQALQAGLEAWKTRAAHVLDALDQRVATLQAEGDAAHSLSEQRHSAFVQALQDARAEPGTVSFSSDVDPTSSGTMTPRRGKRSRP